MPRLSASLVIVSPLGRVLLMTRPATGAFPNLHVFPGGAMDSTDPSLEYCALRETFEETGLLINPKTGESSFMPRDIPFEQAISRAANFNWSALAPISEWTTPAIIKQKSFTTQFYLYEILKEHSLESFKPNDEVKNLEWKTPDQCLHEFHSGKILLFPPQFYLLSYLQRFSLDEIKLKLKNRVIKPEPKGKEGGGVVMDWGEGENAIIQFEGKLIKDIRWKL